MSEQIKAKVVCHSKSAYTGKEIVTFELDFPRLILSEWNTHGAISKNASSSRAIPVAKMLEQVVTNTARPTRFGKANSGMQDNGEHSEEVWTENWLTSSKEFMSPVKAWENASRFAVMRAEEFSDAGYAKQICNRLIEPFQMMKVVATATDWENFFFLRDHPAADPTIEALAKAMRKAKDESTPRTLWEGEWHLPYVKTVRNFDGFLEYCIEAAQDDKDSFLGLDSNVWYKAIPFEDAIQISLSCCSQVSYRKLDESLEKAKSVVSRLNLSGEDNEPVHASPAQHQGSPIKYYIGSGEEKNLKFDPSTWKEGITHVDRDGTLCSNNFKEWVQYRALIPNNVKKG